MAGIFNFQKLKNKKVLLLCHEHADLDSFCSATIIQNILKTKKIDSDISIPMHINEQALYFAFKEKISFIKNPKLQNYNIIITFDFNDYEQLGNLRQTFSLLQKKKCFEVIAFDHHIKEKRFIAKEFVSPNASSTTELIYNNFSKLFSKKDYFYTCIGIVEDTGKFLVGTNQTFSVFADCLKKSGKNYSSVLAFTKQHLEKGERVAFLKAANRAKIIRLKKALIVLSEVSFYQGETATMLLNFGAEISLVAGKEKKGFSVLSARAETEFKEKNKFNLMKDLMIPLQKKFGGEVGGHSGAAQWKGKTNFSIVIKEAVKVLEKKFSR